MELNLAPPGTRHSSMGPPWRIDLTTHRTTSERSNHGATSRSLFLIRSHYCKCQRAESLDVAPDDVEWPLIRFPQAHTCLNNITDRMCHRWRMSAWCTGGQGINTAHRTTLHWVTHKCLKTGCFRKKTRVLVILAHFKY